MTTSTATRRTGVTLRVMRRVPCIAAVLALVVAACGQVEPVLAHVTMPDCTYRGATTMEEGEISLSLTLNGLANAGVVLVRLDGDKGYDDLAGHIDSVSDELAGLPNWVETLIDLRLSDFEGVDGVEGSAGLEAGSYALICVDYPYDDGPPLVRLATPLDVDEG